MKKLSAYLIASLMIVMIGFSFTAAAKEKVVIHPTVYRFGCVDKFPPNADFESYINNPQPMNDFWSNGLALCLFHQSHPGIKVVPHKYPYYMSERPETLTALAGGTAPADLMVGMAYAAKGLLADMTEYVKNWEKAKYIPEAIWDNCMLGGRYYTVPVRFIMQTMAAYKKRWFEEAGIFNKEGKAAPPENWTVDDLLRIAQKITDPKKKHYGFTSLPRGTGTGIWNMIYDVYTYRPDPTQKYSWRAAFNAPENLAPFRFFKKVMLSNCSVYGKTTDLKNDFFVKDLTGICFGVDAFMLPRTVKYYPDNPGGSIGFCPLPRAIADRRRAPIASQNIGINVTLSKEERDATWEWIKFRYHGKGRELVLFKNFIFSATPGAYAYFGDFDLFRLTNPDIKIPHLEEVVPQEIQKEREKLFYIPRPPIMGKYGLSETSGGELNNAINAVYQAVVADPEGVDIQKVANEQARLINASGLDYKLKDVKVENFKEYYSDLAKFYKENYPEYYKEYFSVMFEKYFKIW